VARSTLLVKRASNEFRPFSIPRRETAEWNGLAVAEQEPRQKPEHLERIISH